MVVFVLTYGFMGAELVSIELENTFGTASHDGGVLTLAQVVFEDTFLMIHDADGEAWADALRYKMHQTAQDPISPSEMTGLLRASSLTS